MSVNHALGGWLVQLRDQWFAPVNPPLSIWRRFIYAFMGSFFWVMYLAFANLDTSATPALLNPLVIVPADPSLRVLVFVVVPLVFAWLVSWPTRPYSPTRLFLGGLLLPALATAIARFSLLEWLITGGPER